MKISTVGNITSLVAVCLVVLMLQFSAHAGKPPRVPDPSGLVLSEATADSLTIEWTSGGGTTTGFIVAHIEGITYPAEKCTTGTQVNVGMNTRFVLDGLAADTTVSFRVCAYDSRNKRSTGVTVQGTTEGGLPPVAGISFQPDAVETSDHGERDTISVRLTAQPESDVVINASSSDVSEGIVSPASLLFTPANWDQPQDITVTGVGDEGVVDEDALYEIELAVDTDLTVDPEYVLVTAVYVPAVNWDGDGIIIIDSEDTPKAIADMPKTTVSQIVAFSEAEIGNLELDIDLTHSRMSDLTIELSGPTSTEALAYDGTRWELADPDAFQGELLAGSWQLVITDRVKKQKGTLRGWSLRVIPLRRTYIYRTVDGVDIHATVMRLGTQLQPVVMHIHAGGALFGHRDDQLVGLVDELWNNGYTVVSIDYRLCPAVLLPEIIDDTHVAYSWLLANGPELFNADINRIGVTGGSMGGFLTMLAGYQLDPRPVVVANVAGYTDLTHDRLNQPNPDFLELDLVSEEDAWGGFDVAEVLTNLPLDWQDPEYLERWELYVYLAQQGLWPQMITGLAPADHLDFFNANYCSHFNVTPEYPPTVFVHGALDVFVEVNQIIIMNDALVNADVDAEMIIVPDGKHLLSNLTVEEQAPYWQQARLFLDQYLK